MHVAVQRARAEMLASMQARFPTGHVLMQMASIVNPATKSRHWLPGDDRLAGDEQFRQEMRVVNGQRRAQIMEAAAQLPAAAAAAGSKPTTGVGASTRLSCIQFDDDEPVSPIESVRQLLMNCYIDCLIMIDLNISFQFAERWRRRR